jgi:hypothetical protein
LLFILIVRFVYGQIFELIMFFWIIVIEFVAGFNGVISRHLFGFDFDFDFG